MILLGGLLYVLAEIVAFVVVADHTGFFGALAILVLVSVLGVFVVRHVGLSVVGRTRDRIARGDVPSGELLDGVVVLVGAVLICVPGFIGDALGLLLMVGPLRRLIVRRVGHRLARRVTTIRVGDRWGGEVRTRASTLESSGGDGPALGPARGPTGPTDTRP